MCGITGFWTKASNGPSALALQHTAQNMANALHHRGPDDAGTWADAACGLALGHRRLAIVDLSPAGHQPMVSACGQFVIAFNGEIYNYRELRDEHNHAFGGGWRKLTYAAARPLVDALAQSLIERGLSAERPVRENHVQFLYNEWLAGRFLWHQAMVAHGIVLQKGRGGLWSRTSTG